jgi:hypothetical protein
VSGLPGLHARRGTYLPSLKDEEDARKSRIRPKPAGFVQASERWHEGEPGEDCGLSAPSSGAYVHVVVIGIVIV